MEFKKIQQQAVENADDYGKRYHVSIDENFLTYKLFEETGEFAQALLIHEKRSRPEKFVDEATSKEHLAKELADIVGIAMVLAERYGIDLEQTLDHHWNKDKK